MEDIKIIIAERQLIFPCRCFYKMKMTAEEAGKDYFKSSNFQIDGTLQHESNTESLEAAEWKF